MKSVGIEKTSTVALACRISVFCFRKSNRAAILLPFFKTDGQSDSNECKIAAGS
jgi:hypothetical protein